MQNTNSNTLNTVGAIDAFMTAALPAGLKNSIFGLLDSLNKGSANALLKSRAERRANKHKRPMIHIKAIPSPLLMALVARMDKPVLFLERTRYPKAYA